MDLQNLQMLPGEENMQKNARLDYDPQTLEVMQYLSDKYLDGRSMESSELLAA